MREGLDAYLFDENEGWLPARETILYLKMEVGIIFNSPLLRAIGAKYNLYKKVGWFYSYNVMALKEKVLELYTVKPRVGYVSILFIRKKYPRINKIALRDWVKNNTESISIITVGLMEVIYVKEKSFREFYREGRKCRFYAKCRRIGRKRTSKRSLLKEKEEK